jgi:hypothetical protein
VRDWSKRGVVVIFTNPEYSLASWVSIIPFGFFSRCSFSPVIQNGRAN